jgi:aerobic-type carbon monoxide dehydrogenase small subunit (CoxS/CutS family)
VRIKNHPILNFDDKRDITFYFEGRPVAGKEGDMIAFALHHAGIKTLSYSQRLKRPRGFYCGIGNCGSCHMRVDGVDNVRTCITPIKENMRVEIQKNKGVIK